MNRKKLLFQMKDMEHKTYEPDNTEENIEKIDVPERTCVRLDGVAFNENIVTRIDVFKFKGEKSDSIFVEIFMGNIEIATRVYSTDVVVYIELRKSVHGAEYIKGFEIREARDYDYK